MTDPTSIQYALHPLLVERRSRRAMQARGVDPLQLRQLLEAARWAASCFNEQPWRFIVARREDSESFERLLSCLSEGNRAWAKDAGVLMLSVASDSFARNGKPNRHAWHDVGQAATQMALQATELGLVARQMAGFDRERAREQCGIPEGFEAVAAIAVGHPLPLDEVAEALKKKESAPRSRKLQSEFVFAGRWDAPLAAGDDAKRDIERVLAFWLGELGDDGCATAEARKRWWKKDPAFDQQIRDEFEADYEAIVAGERQGWRATARGRLASIIVLDQFSRNMFRDSAKMYAADELAVQLATDTITRGLDRSLATDERTFCYMPLMHSEQLEHQEQCIDVFAGLRDELDGEAQKRVSDNHRYAVIHRDIVADWGRFPHRNDILGRDSTPEEAEFLKKPGSSF